MQDITFKIAGMHCDGCAARLARLLKAADGVAQADASFAETSAHIRFDPAKTSVENLKEVVKKAGFEVVET